MNNQIATPMSPSRIICPVTTTMDITAAAAVITTTNTISKVAISGAALLAIMDNISAGTVTMTATSISTMKHTISVGTSVIDTIKAPMAIAIFTGRVSVGFLPAGVAFKTVSSAKYYSDSSSNSNNTVMYFNPIIKS